MLQYILPIVVVLLAYFLLFKNKAIKRKTNKLVYLFGESGSGKTCLVYLLQRKNVLDIPQTCSTINETQYDIKTTFQGKDVDSQILDIPGQNYQKVKYISEIGNCGKVIILVDSSNQNKLGKIAEMLYDILIQKSYQKYQQPILIALNKQDLESSIKQDQFELKIQNEIEKLKQSKKVLADESDEVDDLLKQQEDKFSFEKNNIQVTQCSLVKEDIQGIVDFLN